MYSLKSCETLIDKYINEYEGQMTQLEEGVLGLGTLILHDAEGKKTIIIKEVFVNSWTSTHAIRKYNTMPKKYERLIQ